MDQKMDEFDFMEVVRTWIISIIQKCPRIAKGNIFPKQIAFHLKNSLFYCFFNAYISNAQNDFLFISGKSVNVFSSFIVCAGKSQSFTQMTKTLYNRDLSP